MAATNLIFADVSEVPRSIVVIQLIVVILKQLFSFVSLVLADSGVVAQVAVTATLPVLDCLYSGAQRLPRRRLGEKNLLTRKTLN